MTRKQRRLTLIGFSGGVIALALGLVLYAMSGSITFFFGPAEALEQGVKPGTRFRLGGLVKDGSIQRGTDGQVFFIVTDAQNELKVQYKGILPDLFREGQGVIAEGMLDTAGMFQADTILAKHDETYMPREIADTLKKQGHWQGEENQAESSAK